MKAKYCIISKRAFWTLLLVTLGMAAKNIYVPLHPDETYYWQWSRHLDLAYFDGPPLMAYLISLMTAIYGNTVIGVKLAAVLCTSLGVYFVYRLARLLFDESTAYISLLLIIFSPTAQYFYTFSTLDPALFCFWSMTLYCFYFAIKKNSTLFRYFAAIGLGLTILAKYTGVLLGVELFIYLLVSNTYRKELLNIHWYLGVIIVFLILSPVFIWNWQHDFIGFIYQYRHGVSSAKIFSWSLMLSFIAIQMCMANVLAFIGTFYYTIRYWKDIILNEKLLYLSVPFLGTFFFFFYEGLFKRAHTTWPLCAYISVSILLAYFVERYHKKGLYKAIVTSNILVIILWHAFVYTGFMFVHKDGWDSTLIAQANLTYHPGDVVISDRYETASQCAFYLKNQPQVFILDGVDPREYQYWRMPITRKIQEGSIKSALYIGSSGNIGRVATFFNHVKMIKEIKYTGHRIGLTPYKVSLYKVWNS